MLFQVCKHIKNFFVRERVERTYSIENGTIDLPFLMQGQYFAIEGSVLNDGVYQYPCYDLKNETFTGAVISMAIPVEFLDLVAEIEAYEQKSAASPFTSESFGGYSYTKATTASGAPVSWKQAFASRLNVWRRV